MPPLPPAAPGPDFAAAFAAVGTLCDYFDANRAAIMDPAFKEAQARDQLITPFFEALGWDVLNKSHRSVYEKEVVIEQRANIAGRARSADYAFRRPGSHLTSFFVEAKKPSVDIRNHADCYQAVLYGWNANTPLVVLTDFEQLLLLDARSEPDLDSAARLVLKAHGSYTYRDYRDPGKFTELWGLLARHHVAAGSLDRAAAALPRLSGRIHKDDLFARGSGPVDETFLAQMEVWREKLAKSLKRSNHALDGERLTALTQRILDRLVFLRFLEDRGIEKDITFAAIGKGGSAWENFLKVSRRLDDRYNGIIYKQDPDGCENPALAVDEAMFAAIAGRFTPQNSKYLFNEISVTILGSIYERFLGNVIVARDKTTVVDAKPEVRKAGGVYYTPDYIVRYIVEQTVGRAIAGKKPAEIEALRFADIACGSGSFLVEVFACLIRYHLQWYLDHKPERWEKDGQLRQREIDGEYVLTLAEKRRLLLANVYGVDLDPQAVEVTQLSLYLKLMEDESFPSTQALFGFEKRALLPNLRENIICGNSLIETDIGDLFGITVAEQEKTRPLDLRWQFPKVFSKAKGGFDAVVGNPPYVRMEEFKPIKKYLASHFAAHAERADIYSYFIERALSLIQAEGRLGYIVSNKFLRAKYGSPLRKLLSEGLRFDRIVDFAGLPVFKGATVRTIVFTGCRGDMRQRYSFPYSPPPQMEDFQLLKSETADVLQIAQKGEQQIDSDALNALPWSFGVRAEDQFLERLAPLTTPLGAVCTGLIGMGIKSGLTEAFVVTEEEREALVRANKKCAAYLKPLINGRDVRRYGIESTGKHIIYAHHGVDFSQVPELIARLEPFKMQLKKRATKQHWYELQQPQLRYAAMLDAPKLVFPDMAVRPRFALDVSGAYCSNTCYFIGTADLSLLAVLNSSLAYFYFRRVCAGLEGVGETYLRFFGQYLEGFPIMKQTASSASSCIGLGKLVGKLLNARKREAETAGSVKDNFTRQIAALDRQIDSLVYELYGLTDEEIALVEGNA